MSFKITQNIERYVVFGLIVIVLSVPLILKVEQRPAPVRTAEDAYSYLENTENIKGVLVAIDFGPGTSAENKPQAKLIIEHLMRKRIPFALTTLYVLAVPYLKELPLEVAAELSKENPSEVWEYGKDWVNFGYLPSGTLQLQALSKSDNWVEYLKFDAFGAPMSEVLVMEKFKTISDISALVELTGLQGLLSVWLQYFQTSKHTPKFIHGCTSISIPDAFAFYTSGQLVGLFEGIAGAAWYEEKLAESIPSRTLSFAQSVNTGVSFAQILVIVLVVLGNFKGYFKW